MTTGRQIEVDRSVHLYPTPLSPPNHLMVTTILLALRSKRTAWTGRWISDFQWEKRISDLGTLSLKLTRQLWRRHVGVSTDDTTLSVSM